MADDKGKGHDSTVALRNPKAPNYQHHHREIKEGDDSSDSVDLISTLPDVILQHIFSFIPTRFAIRTSVLSKRWKHVWLDTPSLNFDFWYPIPMREPNADLVNKTLTHYTPLKMMSFYLCTIMEKHMPYVDGWIKFVMSRNVEIMSLRPLVHNYKFPDFFYINSSLKELTVSLDFHELKIPTSCSVSWTSLKKLSLCSCHLSRECVDKILSGCPVLETLRLYNCQRMMMMVLDLTKWVCLRRLEIDDCSWLFQGLVHIVAPHIHYLKFTNSMLPCNLVDVSSLTEATLDAIELPKTDLIFHRMMLNMLKKLHIVEKLTFAAGFLKVLSLVKLHGIPFPRFKAKHLTVEVNDEIIPSLLRLIENSPELKKLTIHGTIPKECTDKLLASARFEFISVNKSL